MPAPYRPPEKTAVNSDPAFPPPWHVLQQAIRLPKDQWTKFHEDAIVAFAPILLALARTILRLFGLPADDHCCSDAVQQWWALVLEDRLFSLKPHYGFGKFARLFMMRACGRLADRRRNRHTPLKDEEDNICSKEPNPAERADQLQTREEIATELGRLSETLRQPLTCVFYDGLSVIDTAAKLGIKPGTVSKRLYDAKQILRSRLSRFRE
jgi:RNA polymerase sigma factor (sigma-70 family)